jgi:hypothetical protein
VKPDEGKSNKIFKNILLLQANKTIEKKLIGFMPKL